MGTEIAEVLAHVKALTDEVERLRSSIRRDFAPKKLLSYREAAERLGISRNVALHDLIKSGQLRTVTVNARKRIPASEVDRLCAEGFDVRTRAPRRPRRRPATQLPPHPSSWAVFKRG